MRKLYSGLFLFLVLVLFPMPANAQYNYYEYVGIDPTFIEFNSIGGGARAAGMGGAYLAIGEGAMAYSWNPAAMIYTDKTKLGIQFASVSDKFTDVYVSLSIFGDLNIQPFESEREHFSLDFGGFTAPFSFMDREWAVGGGYRNVYDMNFEFRVPGVSGRQDIFTQARGVDAVSFGIANKIIEGVGAGLTVNAYLRGTESNYYVEDQFLYIGPGYSEPVIADGWLNDNSHFSGFNLDLGLSGDFRIVKGGVVLHTPYDLKQDSKRTWSVMVEPEPLGYVDRVTYTYNMPLSYSIGIGIIPVENFTVAFDFDSRPLSKVDVHTDWEQIIIPDSTFNLGWEDVNQFRVGAEYILDAGFADIPVRAGFRNEPSVSKEMISWVYGVETEGDQIEANILTFGTGLYFEKIWFDAAYQMGSSSYYHAVLYETLQIFKIKRDYSRLFISAGMYF